MLVHTIIKILLSTAFGASPIGFWKTIDDSSGKDKSIVEVYEKNNKVFAQIIKVFPDPSLPAVLTCTLCSGKFKDKPILGLEFMWDLEQSADDKNKWENGQVLDPNNGKIYSTRIEVIEGGARLKIRGFLGFSLLGRTQFWVKSEKP